MKKEEVFYQYPSYEYLDKDDHGRYWTYFYYVNEIRYKIKGITVYTKKVKVRAKQLATNKLIPK